MFPKMICRFSVTTMKILVENDNPSHNKKKTQTCIELQKIPNRQSNVK